MVRKLRYRQAIAFTTKRKRREAYRKLPNEISRLHRQYVGRRLVGTYKSNVTAYKLLVKPETGTPTIPQARVMHTTLGTWDKDTKWFAIKYPEDTFMYNTLYVKVSDSNVVNINGLSLRVIYPKADYKVLKGLSK